MHTVSTLALSFCLVLSLAAPHAAAHDEDRVFVQEWQSATPVDLSVETSEFMFSDPETFPDTVLVSRDDQFADALASAALQGTLGAPLLLTPTAALADVVREEIERLGPDRIYILGGTNAVSPAVEAELRTLAGDVERLSGATRILTAVRVAEEAQEQAEQPGDIAIIVRADGPGSAAYADALAGGGLSAAMFGVPVLLTETGRLSDATAAFLSAQGIQDVYVLGGRAAVSDAAFAQIEAVVDDADRLSGTDRFGTALAAARELYGAGSTLADTAAVYLVDASSPLAWASGFTGALLGGVLSSVLLVDGATIPAPTREWLGGKPITQDDLPFRFVYCSAGVSAATCHAAADIVDGTFEEDAPA